SCEMRNDGRNKPRRKERCGTDEPPILVKLLNLRPLSGSCATSAVHEPGSAIRLLNR
ncbi:hypothetical protein HAX54_009180, partial [Datura stramonium]|nr:hypothetical protein [Datura stramonium]